MPTKQPPTSAMTATQINRELDRLDQERSKLTDQFIELGRGHERASETAKKDDPLSLAWRSISDRHQALRIEIELRYGPGAPSRLPTKGFGPRKVEGSLFGQPVEDQEEQPEVVEPILPPSPGQLPGEARRAVHRLVQRARTGSKKGKEAERDLANGFALAKRGKADEAGDKIAQIFDRNDMPQAAEDLRQALARSPGKVDKLVERMKESWLKASKREAIAEALEAAADRLSASRWSKPVSEVKTSQGPASVYLDFSGAGALVLDRSAPPSDKPEAIAKAIEDSLPDTDWVAHMDRKGWCTDGDFPSKLVWFFHRTSGRKVRGGYGFETSEVFLSLRPRGHKPFNSSTIKAIEHGVNVEFTGDDNATHMGRVSVSDTNTARVNRQQELEGKRAETTLAIRCPKGAEEQVVNKVKRILADDFEVEKLSSWRKAISAAMPSFEEAYQAAVDSHSPEAMINWLLRGGKGARRTFEDRSGLKLPASDTDIQAVVTAWAVGGKRAAQQLLRRLEPTAPGTSWREAIGLGASMKVEGSNQQMKRWMLQNAQEHVDPKTGELNMTSLAEAAQGEFDSYEDEEAFELAFEVGEQLGLLGASVVKAGGLRDGTEMEFQKAISKLRTEPRRMFAGKVSSGTGTQDIVYSDGGTEVAWKTVTYRRGKAVKTTYLVNPDYLGAAPVAASIVQASSGKLTEKGFWEGQRITIKVPVEKLVKSLDFEDAWKLVENDDPVDSPSIDIEDIDLPNGFDDSIKQTNESEVQDAYRWTYEALIQKSVLSRVESALTQALENIAFKAEYLGPTAEGSEVQVSGVNAEVVSASIDDGVVTITLLNPQHLINAIIDGDGSASPDMSVDEATNEAEVEARIGWLGSYFDIWSARKPKPDMNNLDSWSNAEFRDLFAENLKDLI